MDSLVSYIPFPVLEEWGEYGMSLDTAANRIYVTTPGSHIYVFRDEITGITDESSEMRGFDLTIAPNIFRNRVALKYYLPSLARTTIKIYSSNGRLVRTLYQGNQQPGDYCLHWNGQDNLEARLAPGAYFVRLEIGSRNIIRKLILLP